MKREIISMGFTTGAPANAYKRRLANGRFSDEERSDAAHQRYEESRMIGIAEMRREEEVERIFASVHVPHVDFRESEAPQAAAREALLAEVDVAIANSGQALRPKAPPSHPVGWLGPDEVLEREGRVFIRA
jgi:hypothetical protein